MGIIPQSEEDKAFAAEYSEEGCRSGIYQEASPQYASKALERGSIIASAFTVWQQSPEGRKGRFVVNLPKQSKHWAKGSVRMESLSQFGMEIQKGDHFISMDLYKGYRHFRLAPAMRDWFNIHYEGIYYRCIALPFGWGRSPLWFTQLVATFVRELRRWGIRLFAYLDDFLITPSTSGTLSTPRHCRRATRLISRLLKSLGLRRNP